MPSDTSGLGLCATCRQARAVTTRHGPAYVLCGLSEDDQRFARYPRLPVIRCDGYVEGPPREPVEKSTGEPSGESAISRRRTRQ